MGLLSKPHTSQVTNPPGHLWRDKWTALSGPLSQVSHAHPKRGLTRPPPKLTYTSIVSKAHRLVYHSTLGLRVIKKKKKKYKTTYPKTRAQNWTCALCHRTLPGTRSNLPLFSEHGTHKPVKALNFRQKSLKS